ncbi:MAG: histidine phosphatase family protein [Chloroflexota bacterium]|nr:histidine phosphatase family protein [Chloroflexota bacterium]
MQRTAIDQQFRDGSGAGASSGGLAAAAPARVPSVFEQAFLSGAQGVTDVLLVRHGHQDYDRAGPVGAMFDPPLSELGRSQARLVGAALAEQHVDVVYASPLRRALDTGREIARRHGLEPVVIEDLREVGIFRDVPPDETALGFFGERRLAAVRERMIREKRWDVFPYSESSAGFRRRVVEAMESIIAAHPGGRVVVACHGGVINAYIAHVVDSVYDMLFQPAHASISVVAARDGTRALQSLNHVGHLLTAEGSFHSV